MATSPYATLTDLAAWLGVAAPADGTRQIRNACIVIDRHLIGAAYNIDANSNPTDASDIQALKDATCAQVEYWIESGDEFNDGAVVSSYSIEGLAVTFSGPPPQLAARARDILHIAGLLPSQTPIHMP